MKQTFTMHSEIWLYKGPAAWHFLTLPKKESVAIRNYFAGSKRRGFGSIRVQTTLNGYTWKSSIFPDTRAGAYLLPLNLKARRAADVSAGDRVRFAVTLLDAPSGVKR